MTNPYDFLSEPQPIDLDLAGYSFKPIPPLDIEAEVAEGRRVIAAMPDVIDSALIGSAAYLPAELVQDVDFAVLVKAQDAVEYAGFLGPEWPLCGDYDTQAGEWCAVRRGNLNLMLTTNRGFFERYRTAMEVCKALGLKSKQHRIAVCAIVRDGKTADQLIPLPPLS